MKCTFDFCFHSILIKHSNLVNEIVRSMLFYDGSLRHHEQGSLKTVTWFFIFQEAVTLKKFMSNCNWDPVI